MITDADSDPTFPRGFLGTSLSHTEAKHFTNADFLFS